MNEKQVKTKVTEIYCGRAHSWWRHLCVLSCSPVSVSHCLLSSGLHCRRLAQACDRQGAMEASALTFTPVSDTLCLRFAKNEGLILIEVQSRLFFFFFLLCVSNILFRCNGPSFSHFRFFGRVCVPHFCVKLSFFPAD